MSDTAYCITCGKPLPDGADGDRCVSCSNTLDVKGIDLSVPPPGFLDPVTDEIVQSIPQLEVLEPIGKGGMGVVYKARQKGLDRLVALKILPPESQHDGSYEERFMREARALARLNHPNIVMVHDFGQVDGRWYFIMEYVDGVNLRQALRAGELTPERACEIVPAICDALQFAHDEGIVHRDIKPENVLLDKRGRVKIADFGLARLRDDVQQTFQLTGTGDVMGTLHYMAPEQVERPRDVDHRADIYAVGVMFYEMLTGELPLGRFPMPSEKAHTTPAFDDIVLRALEKDPTRRYQQASEIKTDIERASSQAPIAEAPALNRTPDRVTPPPLPSRAESVPAPARAASVADAAPWEAASQNATAAHALSDAERHLQHVRSIVQVGCYALSFVAAVLLVIGVLTDTFSIMLPMIVGFGAIGLGGIRVNRLAYEEFSQVARGETSISQNRRNEINRRRLKAGVAMLGGGALLIPVAGVTAGGIVMILGGILAGQGAAYTGIREWMRRTVEPRGRRTEA